MIYNMEWSIYCGWLEVLIALLFSSDLITPNKTVHQADAYYDSNISNLKRALLHTPKFHFHSQKRCEMFGVFTCVAIFLWNNKSRYTIIKGINCYWNMIKMMVVVVPYENNVALITICNFKWEKSYYIYIYIYIFYSFVDACSTFLMK